MSGGSSQELRVTAFLVGSVLIGGALFFHTSPPQDARAKSNATLRNSNSGSDGRDLAVEDGNQSADVADASASLRFRDFPAQTDGSVGAIPNFRGDQAAYSNFRTLLQSAAQQAPNFAGVMIVVGHGCGTECIQYHMIDSRNGRVIEFYPAGIEVDVQAHALRHQADSNLLLESFRYSPEGDSVSYCYDQAYRWDGQKAVLLASRRHRLPADSFDCPPQTHDSR